MSELDIIEILEYFFHDADAIEVSGNENNIFDIGNEKDSEGVAVKVKLS